MDVRQLGCDDQGTVALRAGPSIAQGGTWSRSLRGTVVERRGQGADRGGNLCAGRDRNQHYHGSIPNGDPDRRKALDCMACCHPMGHLGRGAPRARPGGNADSETRPPTHSAVDRSPTRAPRVTPDGELRPGALGAASRLRRRHRRSCWRTRSPEPIPSTPP
jgi:hypothetical protein